MIASISTDILAIIALCFTIYLTKLNIVVNNYKTSLYISVSIITIVLLILEIATILMEIFGENNLVVPFRLANIIGFSLSPVVPYILLFFFYDKGKPITNNSFLALPLYFNAIMCILSYKTGWIFFLNAQNQYTRGNLFLLPTITSMFYFILMVIAVLKNNAVFENNDKKVLIPLFFMPILGIVVQLLFRDVLLIWGSVSISLLLYYIFLRELQFNYDAQTGIKNRLAFEKEIEQYLKSDKNAAIVVVDINNLKNTNDQHGHKAGDEAIFHAAKCIQESFLGTGKTFRIGGDEFCVICQESSKELIDSALANLEHLLITINQKRHTKIMLAYGYAFYNKSVDIYSTFAQADKAMYTHKAQLKSFLRQRVDD